MKAWLENIFSRKSKMTNGVLGISLTPQNASWCLLETENNQPIIKSFGLLDQTFDSPAEALAALLEQTPIPTQVDCFITLGHQYYDMVLVDSPEVPDLEMSEAVRWKIKDLVSHNVAKCVVDVFRLPEDAYRGRMKMVYAAAAEIEIVSKLVQLCHKADLPLQSIGVNELAMASLTRALAQTNGKSTAFLYLNGGGGTINLVEDGYLYLTRTIEISSNNEDTFAGNMNFKSDPVDNLALDVQRSLDYYESQLGKSSVSGIFIVPSSQTHSEWWSTLKERLPVAAELFLFPPQMQSDQDYGALTAGVVAPALGAALGAWNAST